MMNPIIDYEKYYQLKRQIENFADHAEVNLRHTASSSREAERIRTELTLYYAALYVCQDVLAMKEAREKGELTEATQLYGQAYEDALEFFRLEANYPRRWYTLYLGCFTIKRDFQRSVNGY